MAWVKVPVEHHPIFLDALPKDPRIDRIKMLPESIMADEEELRAWLSRAFRAALALPPKAKPKAKAKAKGKTPAAKKAPLAKKRPAAKKRARR